MIDTVCLTIPYNSLVLLDENNKAVPQWDLQSRTEHYAKYVRNPSKKQRESGLYFPRLTFYSRNRRTQPRVKIEFSVPKLLFNNNLNELSDTDFDSVIEILQDRLEKMGVRVFKKTLSAATVSTVHFSKNVLLKDGYTSSYVISELQKIDLRKSFDLAQKHFINNGQSLQVHALSHELVIYDKIADLGKSKKRAIDKDQTSVQPSLFDSLKSKEESIEVLRIEIRICNKRKLNSLFKKLKLSINPTFHDVFRSEVAKLVIKDYWNFHIKADQMALFTIKRSAKDWLREMCRGDPNLKPKQAIYQIGLLTLAKDGNGLRELRRIFEGHTTDRNWYRIKKDFSKLSADVPDEFVRGWMKDIEKQLFTYEPIKLDL